jgi:hypothetical protein
MKRIIHTGDARAPAFREIRREKFLHRYALLFERTRVAAAVHPAAAALLFIGASGFFAIHEFTVFGSFGRCAWASAGNTAIKRTAGVSVSASPAVP